MSSRHVSIKFNSHDSKYKFLKTKDRVLLVACDVPKILSIVSYFFIFSKQRDSPLNKTRIYIITSNKYEFK